MRILFRALIRYKKNEADATTHLLFSFEFDKFICRFQALYETLLTMHILGFIAAALIGVSLGLIGGGGSILTVPVLVYLFSVQPSLATSYSLFIVGVTSLLGAYKNYRKGLVHFRTALLFCASSVTTVFLIRKFLIPHLPKIFFTIGSFNVTESFCIMIVFALLMLAASVSMIANKKINYTESEERNIFFVLLYGIAIGTVTGFLGAGGGFLLIPTLVLIVKLPMKQAIGTSLLIIALNSLIGFTGDIGHFNIQWLFLLLITSIAAIGLTIGDALNKKINGDKLKKVFGWFILGMSVYIIAHEIFYG